MSSFINVLGSIFLVLLLDIKLFKFFINSVTSLALDISIWVSLTSLIPALFVSLPFSFRVVSVIIPTGPFLPYHCTEE